MHRGSDPERFVNATLGGSPLPPPPPSSPLPLPALCDPSARNPGSTRRSRPFSGLQPANETMLADKRQENSMQQALKTGFSLLLVQFCLTQVAAGAGLKPLKPGQYNIGDIQQICLKDDGTWYGTTFNFGGHWVNFPATLDRVVGAIYGNYPIQGHHR